MAFTQETSYLIYSVDNIMLIYIIAYFSELEINFFFFSCSTL